MMFRYLAVGGRFDDSGGEPSGYMRKLFEHFFAINPKGCFVNGGTFQKLENLVESNFQVIFWMPDVPNDKRKLVNLIKEKNRTALLVTSKNNIEGKYSFHHLVARALSVKANLFVEFKKGWEGKFMASVADPLGNCFCCSESISEVASTLMWRVTELSKFTRIGSIPDEKTISSPPSDVCGEFLFWARKYADIFHELIHAENKDRLLGNLSFRCEEGFPSFKSKGKIFVSRRNVDKRDISSDKLVAVKMEYTNASVDYPYVIYDSGIDGSFPPSVDTPIQLMLYGYYPNIRFMLHSHIYIDGSSITNRVIPCGAIEEFYEIVHIFPDRDLKLVSLNLNGHGSIVMGNSVECFRDIPYVARKVPEYQTPLD